MYEKQNEIDKGIKKEKYIKRDRLMKYSVTANDAITANVSQGFLCPSSTACPRFGQSEIKINSEKNIINVSRFLIRFWLSDLEIINMPGNKKLTSNIQDFSESNTTPPREKLIGPINTITRQNKAKKSSPDVISFKLLIITSPCFPCAIQAILLKVKKVCLMHYIYQLNTWRVFMPHSLIRFFGFAAFLCILAPVSSFSQDYKKIGNGQSASLVLTNCALVDGVNKVKVTGGGKSVALHTLKNRDEYKFGAKYKFFSCLDGVIYAKSTAEGTPVTFDLSLSDFPKSENNVGSACKTVKSWPGSHIYKTVGSHHFTDIRRNTIGLILKVGASGPFPSCVSAIDSEGKEVAKLGLYARGAGWAARYYAGVNCGSGTPFDGGDVASRAKKNTGSNNIYMDFGTVCYGPIDATRCIGSQQC